MNYTVEFYANSGTNPMGLSEGQQFLGSAFVLGNQLVTTNVTLTATFGGVAFLGPSSSRRSRSTRMGTPPSFPPAGTCCETR